MWICTTNNDAIVKGPQSEPLFGSHIRSSEWFHKHPEEVRILGVRLSVMNRTLASRTSLRLMRPEECRPIRRSTLLAKFRPCKERYDRRCGGELEWCQTYMGMMHELMRELVPNGRG